MCEKQCRDENGFKCHQTSEAHLRQMAVYRENSDDLMEQFSKEFEQAFLDTLRRKSVKHTHRQTNRQADRLTDTHTQPSVQTSIIRDTRHHQHRDSKDMSHLSILMTTRL